MTVKELLSDVEIIAYGNLSCTADKDNISLYSEAKGFSDSSTELRKDYIFVALKGTKADGHEYINEAVNNGASLVIVERLTDFVTENKIPYILVLNTRKAISRMWRAWYGCPDKRLKIIGVTGTNGKTSVAGLIHSVITESGHRCALLGTIKNVIGSQDSNSSMTSPDPKQFYSMLDSMCKCKTEYLVMELSSHALALDKYDGIRLKVGIFTNLGHDHFDFHKNIDNYAHSKAKLFNICDMALFNYDDQYGRIISDWCICKKKYYYSVKHGFCDFSAKDIIIGENGIDYCLASKDYGFVIRSRMCGMFSVYNTMAAASCGKLLGFDIALIQRGIRKLHFVKGRFEKIKTDTDFSVYIDFAHTPDALQTAVDTGCDIAKRNGGRLICLFGCGGDRDKEKRPIMGKIASENADIAVITSDNSRSEDPEEIIEEIKSGITNDNNCVFILDRRKAIGYAVSIAEKGDVVLLCGKGHECYEIKKDGVQPFSERAEVLSALKTLTNKA